jgi:hypothetical protein
LLWGFWPVGALAFPYEWPLYPEGLGEGVGDGVAVGDGVGLGEGVGDGVPAGVHGTVTCALASFTVTVSRLALPPPPPPSAVARTLTCRRSVAEPTELTLLNVNVFNPVPEAVVDVASVAAPPQPDATRRSCALYPRTFCPTKTTFSSTV